MSNLIERQAAIDIASGYCHPANIAKELATLPSAQPERKTGYIDIRVISMLDGEDCFCSECGAYCLSTAYKFCPKCGIKFIGVRGERDEID